MNTSQNEPTQNTTRRPLGWLNSALLALTAFLFTSLAAQAQVDWYVWGANNGGSWENLSPARWTHVSGSSTKQWPDGAGVVAELTPPTGQSRLYDLGAGDKTVGIFYFGDTNSTYYGINLQLSNPYRLIFDNLGAGALYSLPIAASTVQNTNSCPIVLNDNLTIHAAQAAGTISCRFTGQISETGGSRSITKTGTGQVVLTNPTNNWSGNTIISNGTLTLVTNHGGPMASVSIASSAELNLNFSNGTNMIGQLYLAGVSQPNGYYDKNNTPGRITGNGVLWVTNGASGPPPAAPMLQWAVGNADWDFTTQNWTNLNDSTLTNYSNTSDVRFNDNNTGGASITVTLNTNVSPISLVVSNSSKDYTIAGTGAVEGGIGLSKFGTGKLTLSGSHTYSGGTTVSNGTLQIGEGGSTGSVAGSIVNNGTVIFCRNSTSGLTLANNISGSGTLMFKGSGNIDEGKFTTSGSFTSFTGDVVIDNARVTPGVSTNFGTGTIYVTNNGTFFPNAGAGGTGTVLNNLVVSGQGFVEAGGAIYGAIRIGGTFPSPRVFSGTITMVGNTTIQSGGSNNKTFNGAISGNYDLEFALVPQVTLGAANTYSGKTIVRPYNLTSYPALTLALNGSISNSPMISLAAGAGLDVSAKTSGFSILGTQTLACSSPTNAAFVNAGTGVAALTLDSGAQAKFEAAGGASTTVGKIVVTNDLNLNGNAFTVNVSGWPLKAGTYTLMECTGTLTGSANATATITGTALNSRCSAAISTTAGAAGKVELVVTEVNTAPEAKSFSIGMKSGETNTMLIIGGKYAPTDANGDPTTVSGVSSAAHGTVSKSLDNLSIIYTPNAGYTGTDSFTYTVMDSYYATSIAATVDVTVTDANAGSVNTAYGPTIEGSDFVVRFAGIPGTTYTVETNSVPSGSGWVKQGNYTAPTISDPHPFGVGIYEVREATDGAGSRYYRTLHPSY